MAGQSPQSLCTVMVWWISGHEQQPGSSQDSSVFAREEEQMSHCLQLSLVSILLNAFIAGHSPPSLCRVKVWWLSDYEQQRVQNIKRQQDLETSLKSSLNWRPVTLELHSFRCSDEKYIEHLHSLYKIVKGCIKVKYETKASNELHSKTTWSVFHHTVPQSLFVRR